MFISCKDKSKIESWPKELTIEKMKALKMSEIKKMPDLRVSLGTPFKRKNLINKSLVQLKILRNSIFAQYGRKFKTPWLRKYFKSRKWYKPGNYNEKMLKKNDKKNIVKIQKFETELTDGLKAESEIYLTKNMKFPENVYVTVKEVSGPKDKTVLFSHNTTYHYHFCPDGRVFKLTDNSSKELNTEYYGKWKFDGNMVTMDFNFERGMKGYGKVLNVSACCEHYEKYKKYQKKIALKDKFNWGSALKGDAGGDEIYIKPRVKACTP